MDWVTVEIALMVVLADAVSVAGAGGAGASGVGACVSTRTCPLDGKAMDTVGTGIGVGVGLGTSTGKVFSGTSISTPPFTLLAGHPSTTVDAGLIPVYSPP